MLALAVSDSGRRDYSSFHKFPVTIGRARECDMILSSNGVWNQHCEILFDSSANRFHFKSFPDAIVFLNGTRSDASFLRTGDILQVGAAQLVFGLASPLQKSLLRREAFFWSILFVALLLQIAFLISL